jgi:uncharacterized membrane protein YfcA
MFSYIIALVIGMTLALLGGGGSIITVPVLIYLLGFGVKTAVPLSLSIVGLTSFFGVIKHYRAGNISKEKVFTFAPLAMLGTHLGTGLARLISPSAQLVTFSIVLLSASILMLKKKEDKVNTSKVKLIAASLVTGVVTGVVGVGGGFLIVPALTIFANMKIQKAVGTSLVIIAINSLIGVIPNFFVIKEHWIFILGFTALSIIGVNFGVLLSTRIPQRQLKRIFSIFLIVMGSVILFKEGLV